MPTDIKTTDTIKGAVDAVQTSVGQCHLKQCSEPRDNLNSARTKAEEPTTALPAWLQVLSTSCFFEAADFS